MIFRVSDTMKDALANASQTSRKWALHKSAGKLAMRDHILLTAEEAHALIDTLYRLPIGAIAIDTEYRFTAPGVPLRGGGVWHDPTTLDPLILTGTVWVPEEGQAIRFLFDLRAPGMATAVEHLLRMHTVFIAHNIKAELHCLWAFGLEPVLAQTYDTFVAARALLMGRGHPSIALKRHAQDTEDWGRLTEAEDQLTSLLSLAGQCEAYALPHPYAGGKAALQSSFLDHPRAAPFSQTQIKYALADAEMTLRLYLAQQQDILAAGLHNHLHSVEFPFAEANARMEYDGVPVDPKRLSELATGLVNAVAHHRSLLNEMGLMDPGSSNQVVEFLCRRGWRDRITLRDKLTSRDETLEKLEALDPAIQHIRLFRRYRSLLNGQLLTGELIGSDGRFHPNHRHLGAETGRSTCSAPNLVGLSRAFRPVITAPEGQAIIEADFSQIEVGIAAAEFNDSALIEAFNSGDVYSSIARTFYWETLAADEQGMALSEFKKVRSDLRDRIKVLVLGVIYGMQDQAVADRFGVPLIEARRQRQAFLDRYSGLRAASERAATDGRIRSYAPILGGLRRHVSNGPKAANQHTNTPIQAAAGVVFRKAVVDLYRHFRGTSVKLILPVHDAVVVECAAGDVEAVRADLARIMCSAVRAYYPALDVKVDVNDHDMSCWNKDGDTSALQTFLAQSLANGVGVHAAAA